MVQRLLEQIVDLLCHIDLGHLQLRQVVRHYCVFEVRADHLLQDQYVLTRELPKAFIHGSAKIRVAHLFSVDNIIDKFLALVQVFNQGPEIPQHQLPILQQLLILLHFFQIVG